MKSVKAPRRKRAYTSTRRREQALATRASIQTSARRLFARDGYAATSIEAIARDAGVAAQTFYATYGSKRAVLFAMLDDADTQSEVTKLVGDLAAAAPDAHRQLELGVAFSTRFYQDHADLVAIARSAGDSDPDLAALWHEGQARRRRGQAPLIAGWANAGALRRGVDAREAADILYSLTGPDAYRLFTTECGWTPARYEQWLVATLAKLLLH